MTTQAIPKLLFISEDTEELMDKRLSRQQVFEQNEKNQTIKKWVYKFNTQIPLDQNFTVRKSPASRQNTQIQDTSIFNAVYNNRLGRLIYNSAKGIVQYDLTKIQNMVRTAKPEKPNMLIKNKGNIFFSPKQEILIIINQKQINCYQYKPNGKVLLITTVVNDYQFSNACFQNQQFVFLWSFDKPLYCLQISTGVIVQIADVQKCTGVNRIDEKIVVAFQSMTLHLLQSRMESKRINLAVLINKDEQMFQYMCMIGIVKLNNLNQNLGSQDHYALVSVYYTAYDLEQQVDDNPCHRYIFFLKGNLYEEDKLTVRGSQVISTIHDEQAYYLDQTDKLKKIGFSCIIQNIGDFVVILVEKIDYVLLIDSRLPFQKLGIFSTWPRHVFKIPSKLSKNNKFLRSMSIMRNMLPFQKQPAKGDSISKLYCNKQFNGQFMRLYFSHKQAELTIQFPVSVLCFTNQYMFRKYAASTQGSCEQDKEQQILKYIKQTKKSKYLLPAVNIQADNESQMSQTSEISQLNSQDGMEQQKTENKKAQESQKTDKKQENKSSQQKQQFNDSNIIGDQTVSIQNERNDQVRKQEVSQQKQEITFNFAQSERKAIFEASSNKKQHKKSEANQNSQLKGKDLQGIQKPNLFNIGGENQSSNNMFKNTNSNPFAGTTIFNKSTQQPKKDINNAFGLQANANPSIFGNNSLTGKQKQEEKKPLFGNALTQQPKAENNKQLQNNFLQSKPSPSLNFGGTNFSFNGGVFGKQLQSKPAKQQKSFGSTSLSKQQTKLTGPSFGSSNILFNLGTNATSQIDNKAGEPTNPLKNLFQTNNQKNNITGMFSAPKQSNQLSKKGQADKNKQQINSQSSKNNQKNDDIRKQKLKAMLSEFKKHISMISAKIQIYKNDQKASEMFNLKNVQNLIHNWNKIFQYKETSFQQLNKIFTKIDKYQKQKMVRIVEKQNQQKQKNQLLKNYKQVGELVDSLCYFVSFFESAAGGQKKSIFAPVLKKPQIDSKKQEQKYLSSISKRIKDIEKQSHIINNKYKHEVTELKNKKSQSLKSVKKYAFNADEQSSSQGQLQKQQTLLQKFKNEKLLSNRYKNNQNIDNEQNINDQDISQSLETFQQKLSWIQTKKPLFSFMPLQKNIKQKSKPSQTNLKQNTKQPISNKPFDSKLNNLTGKREQKKGIPMLNKQQVTKQKSIVDSQKPNSQQEDVQVPNSTLRTVSKAPIFGGFDSSKPTKTAPMSSLFSNSKAVVEQNNKVEKQGLKKEETNNLNSIFSSFGSAQPSQQKKQQKTDLITKNQQPKQSLFNKQFSNLSFGTLNTKQEEKTKETEKNKLNLGNQATIFKNQNADDKTKSTQNFSAPHQKSNVIKASQSKNQTSLGKMANPITSNKDNQTKEKPLFKIDNQKTLFDNNKKNNDEKSGQWQTNENETIKTHFSTSNNLFSNNQTKAPNLGINLKQNPEKSQNKPQQNTISRPSSQSQGQQNMFNLKPSNTFETKNEPKKVDPKSISESTQHEQQPSNLFTNTNNLGPNQPQTNNFNQNQNQGFGHTTAGFGGANRFMNNQTPAANSQQSTGFNPNQMKFGAMNTGLKSFNNFGSDVSNPFNASKGQNQTGQSWISSGNQQNNNMFSSNQQSQNTWTNQNNNQNNNQNQNMWGNQQQGNNQSMGSMWSNQNQNQNSSWLQNTSTNNNNMFQNSNNNNTNMFQNSSQMQMPVPQGINPSMMQIRK